MKILDFDGNAMFFGKIDEHICPIDVGAQVCNALAGEPERQVRGGLLGARGREALHDRRAARLRAPLRHARGPRELCGTGSVARVRRLEGGEKFV